MAVHFVNEKNTPNRTDIGIIISIFSLMISFFLFYEYFFDRSEWINRIRLFKYFRQNRVKLISKNKLSLSMYGYGEISEYILSIDDVNYECWIYEDEQLITIDGQGDSYIGMSVFSPILSIINNWMIGRIRKLEINLP